MQHWMHPYHKKQLVAAKAGPDARYIAYFQDYSNTYAPADTLKPLFLTAIDRRFLSDDLEQGSAVES